MPRIPENGARIVFRAIVARISPTLASVCLLLGRRPVVIRSRDRAFVHQPLHPVEVQAGQIARGLDGGQLRLLLPRVELHEHVPLANRPAGLERDAIDDARQIGADGDALNGGHRADGAQRGRPVLLLRDDRRDGLGRRLEGGALGDGGLNLPELHETEGRDERDRHGQHQDHPFCHELLFTSHFTARAARSQLPRRLSVPAP